MAYLIIKDLQLNNYQTSLEINEKEIVGIFSKDATIVKEFLDIISGVNPNNGKVTIDDADIFNNKDYFLKRLYFDFSKKYLSTLKTKYLEERLRTKYGLSFDKEKFVKICKELDVRGETEITHVYKFTFSGNTFVNFALALSLNKRNLIINNPTKNLNISTDINYISDKLANKQDFDSVILGLDNIKAFSFLLDKLLIFADEKAVLLNPNEESLILFKQENLYVKDILFTKPYIITLNNYSREDFKNFAKDKIEYKKISAYDLESFLFGGV